MRLTNKQREDFVDTVMKALPWKNKMTEGMVTAEIERRAFAALPDDVKRLHKKYPGLVATKDETVKFIGVGGRVDYVYTNIPVIIDLDSIPIDDLIDAYNARDNEGDERDKIRTQLQGVASTCTTLEILQGALPDLISYMPLEVSFPLVDQNVVKTLKSSGLPIPKGAKA